MYISTSVVFPPGISFAHPKSPRTTQVVGSFNRETNEMDLTDPKLLQEVPVFFPHRPVSGAHFGHILARRKVYLEPYILFSIRRTIGKSIVLTCFWCWWSAVLLMMLSRWLQLANIGKRKAPSVVATGYQLKLVNHQRLFSLHRYTVMSIELQAK